MKKIYIIPTVFSVEMIEEDMVCQSLPDSGENASPQYQSLSKENNYVDFSEEIDW